MIVRLTQRQINHGIFGFCFSMSLIALAVALAVEEMNRLIPTAVACGIVSAVLWAAYGHGWEPARKLLVVLLTLIFAVGIAPETTPQMFDHAIYIVPAIALVLTGPLWALGSALTLLGVFVFRVGGGPYTHPMELVVFAIIIGGMTLSRLAIDNLERLEEARREAEAERARAETERARAEQQADELAQRNVEQRRLLELVAELETPAISVADGVLLAPIVGALDSHRAQRLTGRLLQEVSARRARQVILDISGVAAVDIQVAKSLLHTAQALRLLGCRVTLTGISPAIALTLTELGIDLEGIKTVRSPQEALVW